MEYRAATRAHFRNEQVTETELQAAVVQANFVEFVDCSFNDCTLQLTDVIFTNCSFTGTNLIQDPQAISFNNCTGVLVHAPA